MIKILKYLRQFCNTTIIHHYMMAIRYYSSECVLFHLCQLWLHLYVLAAAALSCSFFWDVVLRHLCTTKHNCNQPQVVSWLKSVVTVIPAHYSSTQSMLQFTLHAKCEISLRIIFFCSKLPLEHAPTVWPKCGIFYSEDHLQEKENVNNKIFRSYIYRKSYSKNFKILYTLTAIKIFIFLPLSTVVKHMSFLNYYELSQPMNNAELSQMLLSNAVPKQTHTSEASTQPSKHMAVVWQHTDDVVSHWWLLCHEIKGL